MFKLFKQGFKWIISLLIRLLIVRFIFFILNFIINYILSLPFLDGLLLIIWLIAFLFFVFIKFNVLSYIKLMLTDIYKLYKHDKLLFYLLIFIYFLVSQLIFLLLFKLLSPYDDILIISLLITLLNTSLVSFTDISSNDYIQYMNQGGESSNNSQSVNSVQDNVDTIQNFDQLRRDTGHKLRNLYVNRPSRASIYMNHLDYADRINSLDHNVVCRSLLDCNSPLKVKIIETREGIRYDGIITHELLDILEA